MRTYDAEIILLPIIILSSLIPGSVTEELRAADVPATCSTICGPIVELTNTCDIDPNESEKRLRTRADDEGDGDNGANEADEPIEAQCICSNNSFDVAAVAALCAGCIAQNGAKTEDMDKIMSQCSFSSTSFAPSATTIVEGIQVQATKPTATGTTTGTTTGMGNAGSLTAGSASLWSAVLALGVAFVTLF